MSECLVGAVAVLMSLLTVTPFSVNAKMAEA